VPQRGDHGDPRTCAGPRQHTSTGGALTQLISPGPEFGQLFQGFQHTAFRLEVRDRYDEPREQQSLRRFQAGDPDNLPWLRSWLDMLREHAAEGRRFCRVRVVSVPLSAYSRFGVWCAKFTNAAGEDIRYLARDVANAEALPSHDYWLFDSRLLVQMHFDTRNRFVGGEVIEDSAVIVEHNYWRDAAWHWAVRRDDFSAQLGIDL